MAAPIWKIDNDGTVLTLTSSPYFLKEQQLPLPDVDSQYASSVTTEGDRLQSLRYRNRKITLGLRIVAASTAAAQTAVNDLQAKVGKINRDAVIGGTGYGGTLEFTTVNGTVVKFDVCSATMTSELGKSYVVRNGLDVSLEFECAPFARGAEVDLGDNSGTAPMLVFTDTNVGGDVPGLGRLVVDNDSTSDAASLVWGLRSYYYSSAATAALTWQAEALTAMNAGAIAAAGPTGSSGSGSNTIKADKLTTAWQPILKSTVSSTYWTHTGAYRVYARVYGVGSGQISVRGSYALADIVNFSTNTAKALPTNLSWCLMDLGVVRIPTGNARWEFRVEARSSTNTSDDIHVDWLALVPIDEGFGVASTLPAWTSGALQAQDAFDQGTSTITSGSTPLSQLGGTWTLAGSTAGDFSVNTSSKRLQRTATGDTTNSVTAGRYIVETNAASPYAAQRAQVTTYYSAPGQTFSSGVMLRYNTTGGTNFLVAYAEHNAGRVYLSVAIVINGTATSLATDYYDVGAGTPDGSFTAPIVIDAAVLAEGDWIATMTTASGYSKTRYGKHKALAPGGACATGKYGVLDLQSGGSANTRTYDNFYGWVLGSDAVVYAASAGTPRPLTLDHKSIVRADSSNAVTTRPATYSGDYLLVPPAGKESRVLQMAVRLGRNLIDGSGDDGTSDALSARLYVTPRYLQLPS